MLKRNSNLFILCALSLLSVFLLFLPSCEKETTKTNDALNTTEATKALETDRETPGEFDYKKDCPDIKGSIYVESGMLVFSNMDHFEKCISCLENDYEVYNDDYEAQYPDATPEELDDLDIVNDFDEWTPYIDFEKKFEFSSLRRKIEDEIVAWLDTPAETIDFDDDPDESVPVIDESTRSLLNEDGHVKVGDKMLTLDDWTDKSIPDECGFQTKSRDSFYEEDNPVLEGRRLKVTIKVASGLVKSKLKGKVRHYKRKGNKWKKRRAWLKIAINGPMQSSQCELQTEFWNNSKGYKKRKTLSVKDYKWLAWREAFVDAGDPRWAIERCWAIAFFDKNDNNIFSVPLQR